MNVPSLLPRWMAAALTIVSLFTHSVAVAFTYPDVTRDYAFAFPRDHGAHPEFRTEWWYVTGWLKTAGGDELGFQVTFFRSRLLIAESNPSRFAPKQLLVAHAALADPKGGALLHDQRVARAGFGFAEAANDDANVVIDGWSFRRDPAGTANRDSFRTRVAGDGFGFDLALATAQPPLLEGADASHPGYSQKGPNPRDASRYYSMPQLRVSGSVTRGGKCVAVTGIAWLDREWSSSYLDPRAAGWDWIGINLDDGGTLMAFRMRAKDGGADLWAGATRRHPDGRVERFGPNDVRFTPLRFWRSPRTGASWPVTQRVEIGHAATPPSIVLEPIMDDQELDSRASTGTIYWEGAVRALRDDLPRTDPRSVVGKGYLELTGYWQPIEF